MCLYINLYYQNIYIYILKSVFVYKFIYFIVLLFVYRYFTVLGYK